MARHGVGITLMSPLQRSVRKEPSWFNAAELGAEGKWRWLIVRCLGLGFNTAQLGVE
jgi:hypothetical protein